MTNNIYIAVQAYTDGAYNLTSFALTEITQTDLEVIKENTDLLTKSQTARKVCVTGSDFYFIDDEEVSGADNNLLFKKIVSRIESDNSDITILSKQEYDLLLASLPTLKLEADELQIYKDGSIRAFTSIEQGELINIYTESFNPLKLTN